MLAYYSTYNDLFKENLPKLYSHFNKTTLSPDLYLLDWIYTIFTKAMNLDLACRVWDLFLRDGEPFLFRTALGKFTYWIGYTHVLLRHSILILPVLYWICFC